MQAMRCACGRRLGARDRHALCDEVSGHLRLEHGASGIAEEEVREIVASRSYRYEYVAGGADGQDGEEEFGPEPY